MSKEHVKILKQARRIIKAGNERYICHAVSKARNALNCEYCEDIKYWIGDILNYYGVSSYSDYIFEEHYSTYMKMKYEDFQEGRLQWIDWMIKNHRIFNKYSSI